MKFPLSDFQDWNHEPYSSLYAFSMAVKGKGLSPEMIRKYFRKLVDKSDYARSDLPRIYKGLDERTRRIA